MSVITVEAGEATIDELLAKVEAGDEVVIARGGQPVARLVGEVPVPPRVYREAGGLAGLVWIAEDFDDPLPEEILSAFEGPVEPSEAS